jgi:DNA end-binding protein Ku
MQAIWKGQISFGLVTIPVSLYTATDESTVSFRQLHDKDHSPIKYEKVCAEEGIEVPSDEIVKGYEYEKGHFVIMDEEDFEKVDVELTKTIDMINFIKADDLDPMWIEKPYYLEPRDGGGAPYELLRKSMEDMGYIGIAKTVLRNREHLAALIPRGQLLVLELLRFSDEIRDPDRIDLPKKVKIETKHLALAKELIERMTEKFDYEEYVDEYSHKLMDIIRQKAEGKEIAVPKREKVPEVQDLMEALERSLDKVPA